MFGFGRELLDDTDSRVAYYSSAFLLKARMLCICFLTKDYLLSMWFHFKSNPLYYGCCRE